VRGDYPGALSRADQGLARHPDEPWLLYDRGASIAQLARTDEALAVLARAEARFPREHERSLAVYRRVLTLERAGRCAEAAAASVAPVYAGDCFPPTAAQAAERRETQRLRHAAADENATRAAVASTGAVNALVAGDYPRALELVDAGLAAEPDDPWLQYDKGSALIGLARVDEALATLRAAERSFPIGDLHGRSVATYRRKLALEVTGRCDEARSELQHYAALLRTSAPDERRAVIPRC
jgi:tetratricopeptide (TPR) repeat protein